MRSTLIRTLLASGLCWLAVLAAARPAPAAEPAREFLEQLRERGYFDTALDYLDRISTSQSVPVELKQTLDYERGTTLIDASRLARDIAIRQKYLDEAQTALQAFVAKNPTHRLVFSADKQVGNLLVERARIILDRAKKSSSPAAQLKTAHDMYNQAYEKFDTTKQKIAKRLAEIPTNPNPRSQAALIELRDQLRIDYLQTQLLAAAIKEESADALDKKSAEYKKTLEDAAKEYGEIYTKYRTRLAGLYARMYQGRCFQKIGNDKEALSFFEELLTEDDSADEVRTLKTKVLVLAIKSWASESQKKPDVAVDRGTKWLERVRPVESKNSDWLELRVELAKAVAAHADTLRPKSAAQAEQQMKQARTMVKFVANVPGEFQKEARDLLAKWGPETTPTGVQPKTFQEAFDAGRDTLDNMKAAQLVVQAVPARLKAEKDQAIKADLQKQLDDAQQTLATAQDEALRLFRAALGLAKEDTDMAQVNLVQYFLCYLSYLNGNYYDAGVYGQFVAERYPDSPGARQCAKIAMAAYVKLFADEQARLKASGTPDSELYQNLQFEAEHVVGICEYITKKWPDQPEAEEALNTLIPFMIQNKQLDKAVAYLDQIPVDSTSRGAAELKTGQAMWATYLRGMQEVREWESEGAPAGVDLAARKQEMTDLKARAEKTLSDGVQRMKASGEVSPTFAAAVLSLAQIYVDTNQADKAIAELEDAKVGPLTLLEKNDPATSREGFAEETLKVALRAYIGALVTAKDSKAVLDKASGVMDKLREVAGDTPEGRDKLIRSYISIAQDLKSQIDLAETPAAKNALSAGFETFLKRVGGATNELNVMNWVAETFYGMGEALQDKKTGALSAEAKRYFTEAQTSFEKMLDKANKQSGWASESMVIQMRMRLAGTKRKLGNFEAAVKELEEVLKTKNAMVNVQIEAAQTYQDWAAEAGDQKLYYRAIMGSERVQGQREPVIWGWGLMSNKTATNPQFRDTFMEARYNLALCRYRMAKLQKEKAKQRDMMVSAKKDVKNVTIVAKDYGGEKWRAKFDRLVQDIQKDLGEKQVGLKEFDQAIKPVSTTAS